MGFLQLRWTKRQKKKKETRTNVTRRLAEVKKKKDLND